MKYLDDRELKAVREAATEQALRLGRIIEAQKREIDALKGQIRDAKTALSGCLEK